MVAPVFSVSEINNLGSAWLPHSLILGPAEVEGPLEVSCHLYQCYRSAQSTVISLFSSWTLGEGCCLAMVGGHDV